MGGIISVAIAGITSVLTFIFETAGSAVVLYLGGSGAAALAGAGINALAAYSVPAALAVLTSAYSASAIYTLGATLGGSLLVGVVVGLSTGLALSQVSDKTLLGVTNSSPKLIDQLAEPLINYVNRIGQVGGANENVYSRSQSRSTVQRKRRAEDGQESVLFNEPQNMVRRPRRSLVGTKSRSAPRPRVVQQKRQLRRKARR